MQVRSCSCAAPGAVNEDVLVVAPTAVAVLDGATAVSGVDSGCRHTVAWFVRRLGAALAGQLVVESAAPLTELLAESIAATVAQHAGDCDLSNPDSPSATVSILRRRGDRLDYLVLADSPVLIDDGTVRVISDDRLDRLPDYSAAGVAAARNAEGGFWVASTRPEAAGRALTGALPVAGIHRAAVLSDGATRLVECFDRLSWAQLLDQLDDPGPAAVIERTRRAEIDTPQSRGKRHDDATAVLVDRF